MVYIYTRPDSSTQFPFLKAPKILHYKISLCVKTFKIPNYLGAHVPSQPDGNPNPKSQEQPSSTYYFVTQ